MYYKWLDEHVAASDQLCREFFVVLKKEAHIERYEAIDEWGVF